MSVKPPVYMDFQATTPLDPEVLEAMLPYWKEQFGNPHARAHAFGWRAEEAVEIARREVAAVLGADPREVIFTSGATESNNLAIKGVAHAYATGERKHLITVETEHKCVLESFRHLEREGWQVTVLPVQPNGLIDLKALEAAMREQTLLVSVMAVNNEIGVIQPIAEIGALCHARGILFHCDAAQAFGKIPLNVEQMHLDLVSVSAHKAYGPQGVGALYVRRRPRVRIESLFDGGGQERGVRSGTVPLALTVGLGKAAAIAGREMERERIRLEGLYRRFLAGTVDARPESIVLYGDREQRWPGNINLGFDGTKEGEILMALKGLAVSSGSACASSSTEPSYVLQAIGVPQKLAHTAIRFGIGRTTSEAEIDYAIEQILQALEKQVNKAVI